MVCRIVTVNGQTAFVCTRGSAQKCSAPGCDRYATKLCDYPIAKGMTCDAPICQEHSREVGLNQDHCLPHFEAMRAR